MDNSGVNGIICAHFIASENMPQLDRQIGIDPQPTLEYRLRSQLRLDSEGKYYIENDNFNHILYNTLNRNVEVFETGLSSHFNPKDGMHTVVGTKDSLNKKPVLMKMYSETRDKFGDLTPHLSKYTPTTSVQEPAQPLEAFIYPNPASDYITISSPLAEGSRVFGSSPLAEGQGVFIYNTLGNCVLHTPSLHATSSEKGNLRVDVSLLPPGVYFIRIGTATGMFVKM